MNRKLLRRVARKHGISVEDVRRDIQSYIDYEYKSCKGNKPTADEIIKSAVNRIKTTK